MNTPGSHPTRLRRAVTIACALVLLVAPGAVFGALAPPDPLVVPPKPPAKSVPKPKRSVPSTPSRTTTPSQSARAAAARAAAVRAAAVRAAAAEAARVAAAKAEAARVAKAKAKARADALKRASGSGSIRNAPQVDPSNGPSDRMLLIFLGTLAGVALVSIAGTRLAINRAAAARAASAPIPFHFPTADPIAPEPPAPLPSSLDRELIAAPGNGASPNGDHDSEVVPLESARAARRAR